MNSRSLQTTIIFLVVGGILVLAFSGALGSASRGFTSVLVDVQTWISSRFLGFQDFVTAPRDIVTLRTRNAELEAQVSQLQAQLIALAHERRLPVLEQPLIRLAVAESILHDILGRDLIALLRRNASVRLEIISIDSELGLQALDADVVVWLSGMDSTGAGPSFAIGAPEVLARLDYSPHIAKRYSRLAVRPDSIEDLADYMLVQWQPDRQVEALRPWNSLVEQRLAGVVRVEAYPLMLEMIRCSACIGLLPRYMSCFDRGLTALDGVFLEGMQRQVWMGVSADVRHPLEVGWVVEMIRNTFLERGEWFD